MSRQFWTGSDTARAYSYDAGGRLSGYSDEELTTGSCGGSWDPHSGVGCNDPQWNVVESTSLSYDKVGNRTDSGAQVGNGNRLLAFDGYDLTWDAAGNLIQKSGNGVNQQFFWSATGRLDSVSTGSGTVRYSYDAFGRRVRVEGPGGTREYIYDGDDIHLELNGSGNVVAKYAYYPGVDRPHSMRRGGTTYYFATDRLETILGLFNSSGNVVNQYRYKPFGMSESATEGVENPLRYTAREYDATTELYYYRARFYDPALGRFISEDPIGLAGGINPYVYAGNDPVNNRDPSGLQTSDGGSDDCEEEQGGEPFFIPGYGMLFPVKEVCAEVASPPWDDRSDGTSDNFGNRGRGIPTGGTGGFIRYREVGGGGVGGFVEQDLTDLPLPSCTKALGVTGLYALFDAVGAGSLVKTLLKGTNLELAIWAVVSLNTNLVLSEADRAWLDVNSSVHEKSFWDDLKDALPLQNTARAGAVASVACENND